MTALLLAAGVLFLAVVASALLEPHPNIAQAAGAADGKADKAGRRRFRAGRPEGRRCGAVWGGTSSKRTLCRLMQRNVTMA